MNNKLLKSLLSVLIATMVFTGSGIFPVPYASAQQDSPAMESPSGTPPKTGTHRKNQPAPIRRQTQQLMTQRQ